MSKGGLSFVFCGICSSEFLQCTETAILVASNAIAVNVCDRCSCQGYACVDCGEYCEDGRGWCDRCASYDQNFDEQDFDE